MALSLVQEGAYLPVAFATDYDILTIPYSGIFTFFVDGSVLAGSEAVTISLMGLIYSLGTLRSVDAATLTGVLTAPLHRHVGPVPLPYGGRARLNQANVGSLRTFQWSVVQTG